LANLPYVGEDLEVSPETRHEPKEALYADDGGLALIYRLLEETPGHLTTDGHLFIEADPRQHDAITKRANVNELSLIETQGFILVFQPR
jgi:methylase of polypeptide subunit release factors